MSDTDYQCWEDPYEYDEDYGCHQRNMLKRLIERMRIERELKKEEVKPDPAPCGG